MHLYMFSLVIYLSSCLSLTGSRLDNRKLSEENPEDFLSKEEQIFWPGSNKLWRKRQHIKRYYIDLWDETSCKLQKENRISAMKRLCSNRDELTELEVTTENIISASSIKSDEDPDHNRTIITCPSCGHPIELYGEGRIHELPGLPAGMKFDPTDQEILEHLEAKVGEGETKLHPLIDKFIQTLEGDGGICYTHPEMLPGVRRDGQIRHFFHRPSKAYTTGTRKRRKVQAGGNADSETRWHKTGKTRPILAHGKLKGFKKILVLYTNYGRQRKPEKTNWVMHQYHLGDIELEKDGELIVSKVFYQTQPRQCGLTRTDEKDFSIIGKEVETRTSYSTGESLQHGNIRLLEEYSHNHNSYNRIEGGYEPVFFDQNLGMVTGPGTLQLIPNPSARQEDESAFAQFIPTDLRGPIRKAM